MLARHRIREVGNWVNLSTAAGLALARIGRCRVQRFERGLWLADHYRPRFPIAGAFTIGNVLITGGDWEQLRHRPGLLDHEERHSWQWWTCLGIPFLPLYLLAMVWSWVRTGDQASRNIFERDAGLERGAYVEHPPQPLRSSVADLRARLRR